MTSHNYLFKNDISDPDNNVYGWLDFYDKQGNNPFVFYRGPTEDNAMEKAWGIIKMR